MKKVKLGFLGCGFMGQLAHLQNYAALDSCEIIGLTDVKERQARLVAAAYGVPKVYASAEELLSDPEVEAVVASQPFDNHVNIARRVLEAGKNLLTEKPLCVYPQNGAELVECAARNNKIHMVANHKRSDLAVEYAVRTIAAWKASREYGAMKYIRVTMPPGDWISGAVANGKPISTDEKPAAYEPERIPEGVDPAIAGPYISFVNYYIHQVNLLRLLYGEDFALTFADKSGVMLATESASGVCGAIEMAPYSTTDGWHETFTVCFEKGFIKVDLPAPLASQRAGTVAVFTDTGGGAYFSPALPNVSAMRSQAANFIKAVNGEIEPPCPSSEAVKDLEFALGYVRTLLGK